MAAAAIPLITTGISALAGLFGGRPKETKTTTDQTSNQQFNQSYRPDFSPLQQQLMDMFTKQALSGLGAPNLSGYAQQGLQQIADQGNLRRQVIGNTLAARGLSYSNVGPSLFTKNLIDTGGQQSQFLAQLPLLMRQYQNEGFRNLLGAFSAIPTGSTSSGSSNSTMHGTQIGQQPGNMTAGFLSGLGAALPQAFPKSFGGSYQGPFDMGNPESLSTYTGLGSAGYQTPPLGAPR